ncbi:uncharacterized protein PHACADRAFT_155539 [Phanerochaete carnosa HHB-10118-sp]|uniref:Major facilitator superfamily (MFS) profile domain-containing protein n=1 Tax=Phanerochaete carnosa (strain HHB-10118-sp) TaxID=650164 RepID=K5WMJ5_PHACS|nr:uncharacterized protein PHACADRAFT_155539 [Phanerochaete carnosa HHB-10118-sp]EKM60399.1 hypothetical protein PHACADRAFT_155539 [Phanerochaete carnosa HHB-10118-sp]
MEVYHSLSRISTHFPTPIRSSPSFSAFDQAVHERYYAMPAYNPPESGNLSVALNTSVESTIADAELENGAPCATADALAATALLPATGSMAQVFGWRFCMLLLPALFALGSALCGAAKTMNWLIAARTVQGAGGSSIITITAIVIANLVPLSERALYNGLVATGMGPIVGGALADNGQWRWLFYLNLPLAGVAGLLVISFLKIKTPQGSFHEKMARMDWISTAVAIALTWGGVQHLWSSAQILASLIIRLLNLLLFLLYEAKVAKHPLVPISLLSNHTSFSGYAQTFMLPILAVAVIYFMPVLFQASWGALLIRSGVLLLGVILSLGPILILNAISINVTKMYRLQLWIGWAACLAGRGVLATLNEHTDIARAMGRLFLFGIGSSFLYLGTYYPVLALLPATENARAMAFFQFCQSFSTIWGATIGTAVLQTQLKKRLPAEFINELPGGIAIVYSAITVIPGLPKLLHTQVRAAFADSICILWQVFVGIGAIGLLVSLLMKGLPLHTQMDEQWGLEEKASKGSIGEGQAQVAVLEIEPAFNHSVN